MNSLRPSSEMLETTLCFRFGRWAKDIASDGTLVANQTLARMAARGSSRRFRPEPVPIEHLRILAAVALAAPTKSDLQQCDIILIEDDQVRKNLNDLIDQDWLRAAPALIVFCGNNRRQRLVHDWTGLAFANDHLDAFFNATVDAAVVLSAYITAAQAAGFGACPITSVRDRAYEVSELLRLPRYVFPVAGLAVGRPTVPPEVSPRLPLSVTVHTDRYSETDLRETIGAYDRRRETIQPYPAHRDPLRHKDRTGPYGWSEDKARQYTKPERTDFSDFVRGCGFRLDGRPEDASPGSVLADPEDDRATP